MDRKSRVHQEKWVEPPKGSTALRVRGKWVLGSVFAAVLAAAGLWGIGTHWLSGPGPAEPGEEAVGGPSRSGPVITHQVEESKELEKEVLAVARELLERFPEHADVLALTGNVYHLLGDTSQAVSYWEQCLERDPTRADGYQGMARNAQVKGEFRRAEELWRKAVEKEPGRDGLHQGLALSILAQARLRDAVAVLEKGSRIHPGSDDLHFLLGQTRLQLEEYETARKSYETAVRLRPGHTNAHYGLARVCGRLGDREAARRHMERFQELKARDMKVLKDRNSARDDLKALRTAVAEALVTAGKLHAALENPGRAKELWVRAAGLDPHNVAGRLQLAAWCQQTNRPEEALKWCQQLCALEPGNVRHFLNAGLLNARLGHFEGAEKAFLAARRLAPANPWPCRDLARLYLSRGSNHARARKLAEEAVGLDPSARNYFILSWACDRGGDLPAALEAMQRALELDPDNPEFRSKYEQLASRR